MPTPETAKWEETLLEACLRNIQSQIDIAILVADSLGKSGLREKLECMKAEAQATEYYP